MFQAITMETNEIFHASRAYDQSSGLLVNDENEMI